METQKTRKDQHYFRAVAYDIRHLLGDGEFIAVTGATHFVATRFFAPDGGLSFNLPDGRRILIARNPNGTYAMRMFDEASNFTGAAPKVNADALRETFTKLTGLSTHLTDAERELIEMVKQRMANNVADDNQEGTPQ